MVQVFILYMSHVQNQIMYGDPGLPENEYGVRPDPVFILR